jgi:hypothetical protein
VGKLLYCFTGAILAIRITEIGADFKRVNVRVVTANEGLGARAPNLGTGKFD